MRRTLLVIDDTKLIRQAAEIALTQAGWTVLTAAGGREGIALAAAERPDAILLDVVMDDLDGPETLRLLREQESTSGIPVLFLTGLEGESGFDAGDAAGVLPKPFDIGSLPADVSAALGWGE